MAARSWDEAHTFVIDLVGQAVDGTLDGWDIVASSFDDRAGEGTMVLRNLSGRGPWDRVEATWIRDGDRVKTIRYALIDQR